MWVRFTGLAPGEKPFTDDLTILPSGTTSLAGKQGNESHDGILHTHSFFGQVPLCVYHAPRPIWSPGETAVGVRVLCSWSIYTQNTLPTEV